MAVTFMISLVTWNRLDILTQVLDAIEQTCAGQDYRILVSDNGSTDGTPDMLRNREIEGRLRAWLLPENVGIAKARNAHWGDCIGHDAIRMDDKVQPFTPGWFAILQAQSEWWHCLIGTPYDPTVRSLWLWEPLRDMVLWKGAGEGGPMCYVPGAVSEALGMWDELPGVLYGWEDILYLQRAQLLGWHYGFTLRVKFEFLAQASEATRRYSQETYPIYLQRAKEYEEAARDLYVPLEESYAISVP